MWRLIPAIISFILLAAHFLHGGNPGLAMACLGIPLAFFIRQGWVLRIMRALLVLGVIEWVTTTLDLRTERVITGEPWVRLVLIMSVVALFTLVSTLLLASSKLRGRYSHAPATSTASVVTFILTAALLSIVQLVVKPPFILLERFIQSGGWVEVFWLSIYAAFLAGYLDNPDISRKWRPRIWGFFSSVFFLQLIIGLLGADKFLMTGDLHLPVPALIIGGPIFRGEGFFMPILFGATLLLVGPGWCGWLCYIGAWDHFFSGNPRKRTELPWWREYFRAGILVVIVAVALVLRLSGASTLTATVLAAAFGVGGVGVMAFLSGRTGQMVHCTSYCPMGFVAVTLGKISPFRIRIRKTCTDCWSCSTACRYDALDEEDIKRRSPGLSCTLCGDCVSKCHGGSIHYTFPGLTPTMARRVFLVMVISLHAVFLGVARM